MEAYKVWASLNLKGNAFEKINKFTKDLSKSSKAITVLNQQLMKMGNSVKAANPYFASLARNFNAMAADLKPLNSQMSGFSRRLSNTSPRIDRMSVKVGYLDARLKMLSRTASGAGAALQSVGGAMAGGGGGRRGGGRRGYSMHHAAAMGLGMVAPEIAAVGYAASYGPAGIAAAGAGILGAAGWSQQKQINMQMAQLKSQGFTPEQLDAVRQQSMQGPRGVSPLSMTSAYTASYMATRSQSMAAMMAPQLAKAEYIANTQYGGISDSQLKDLMAFSEIMGGSDPKKIMVWMGAAMRQFTASGGTIMPGKQATYGRQAGGAMSQLTPEGYFSLEPVQQEMGSSRLGTALTTGARSFTNPQISHFAKQNYMRMNDLGVWDTKTGHMKQKYLDLYNTDPYQFLKQVWWPALRAHGMTSDMAITQETTRDFPRTTGQWANVSYKNREKMERNIALMSGFADINTQFTDAHKNEGGAQQDLSASWDRLATAFGKLADPLIIKGMNLLSWYLEGWAKIFEGFSSFNLKDSTNDLSKFGAVSLANMAKNSGTSVIFNLDSKPFARAILPAIGNAASQAGTIAGNSGFNTLLNPTPAANNQVNGGMGI